MPWNPPQHAQLIFLVVLLLRLLYDGLERGICSGFLAQSLLLCLGLALADHLHVLSDAFFFFLPSLLEHWPLEQQRYMQAVTVHPQLDY